MGTGERQQDVGADGSVDADGEVSRVLWMLETTAETSTIAYVVNPALCHRDEGVGRCPVQRDVGNREYRPSRRRNRYGDKME